MKSLFKILVPGILDSAAKKQWQIENEYEINGSPGASDNIPKKSRINRLKLVMMSNYIKY